MLSRFLIALCLVTAILAASLPVATHRGRVSWIKGGRLPSTHEVEVVLALRQSNLNQIFEMVEEISNPVSPRYGKYLSIQQIANIVAPQREKVDTVLSWVRSIGAHHVHLTKSRDFVLFRISASKLEVAFNIRMNLFMHKASGRVVARTLDQVMLPPSVASEVELVLGLTDFFDYTHERKLRREIRSANLKRTSDPTDAPEILPAIRGSESEITARVKIYCQDGTPASSLPACAPDPVKTVDFTLVYGSDSSKVVSIPVDSTHCSAANGAVICQVHSEVLPYRRVNFTAVTQFTSRPSSVGKYGTEFSPAPWVTPQLVNQMYGIPQGWRASHPNNSQSVVGFEAQYISLDDLSSFFQFSGMPQEIPTIVGTNDPTNPGGESTLDIQWVMAIGAGVPTTFWSVSGPGPTHGNGAYILTWALQIADTENPPLVTSISYGDTEQGFFEKFGNYDYINRMNAELAKMALRGLTVIAGSGDAGATNVGEDGNDISDTDPTCTPMRPFFPSNSPYVVSVSSTFPSINALPICHQEFMKEPIVCSQVGEVAVSVRQGTHWTTGGGFSNLTSTPKWQAKAVQQFLKLSAGNLPPTTYWNPSGRGYPDISTVGFNLFVVLGGQIVSIGGTSASGPVLAGIFALLNDIRLNNGQPSIGLVTPLLYAAQDQNSIYFRDIVVGENFDGDLQVRESPFPTYCPYGFSTQVGWDAVTGLGTPNFKFLQEVLSKAPSNFKKA